MSSPKTISRAQTSREALRIWERIRDVCHNEEAWAILEEELDSIRTPCRCKVGKRYRLDQGDCTCRGEEE